MINMQFADSQFDVIVSSMAIHNVPTPEGRYKAIKEISRVIKSGGSLVIQDFQYTKDYAQALKKLGWHNVRLSRYYFTMFPPVRLVTGIKSTS